MMKVLLKSNRGEKNRLNTNTRIRPKNFKRLRLGRNQNIEKAAPALSCRVGGGAFAAVSGDFRTIGSKSGPTLYR